MECKFVLDTFEKCGGKLMCNYQNGQCTVLNTNLKCFIRTDDDALHMDRFLWKNMHQNNASIKIIPKENDEYVPMLHRFQDSSAKTIVVNTLKDT